MSAFLRPIATSIIVLALLVGRAEAQAQVRVNADQVNVWQPGFAVVATVARAGDVFDVAGRQGNWVEVFLPGPAWQPRRTGFIAASRVEPMGTPAVPGRTEPPPPPPRVRTPREPEPQSIPTRPTARAVPRAQAARPSASRANVLRVFGEAGYGWFSANQSFTAVTGKAHGPWLGGGARYELGTRYFVEGSLEHFRATGERVFVFDDVVYGLGIEDRVSVTPIMGTAGLQFAGRRYTTYVGGGIGAYLLRETSDFADDADDVRQTKAGFRGLLGVQWPIARRYSAGIEVQFTTVPDGLAGGVAEAFKESDLGGLQIRAKVLFGR